MASTWSSSTTRSTASSPGWTRSRPSFLPAKKAAGSLVEVTTKIEGILDVLLKLPLPSTLQATLFAASEDATLLRSQAQVIETLLGSIEKTIDAQKKEGDGLSVQNMKWIGWAAKAADKDVQELIRNARSKTPR